MNGSHNTYSDAFNARSMRPDEVAETFTPPSCFQQLATRRHSVVVGPRGAGKTTLLKMLQQRALESWNHPEANTIRSHVTFTGAFIATDVRWKSQVDALQFDESSDQQHRVLAGAAFTTATLMAVLRAMRDRIRSDEPNTPHRRIRLSPSGAGDLARGLAGTWHLRPQLNTLAALSTSIANRLLEIREIASRETLLGTTGRDERFAQSSWLHMDMIDAVSTAVTVFNEIAEEEDSQWALMFDELELAPQWLREHLFQCLRSVDSRLIFKLAISPYDEQTQPQSLLSPMPDNDYDLIPLAYSRHESLRFSESIWKATSRGFDTRLQDPHRALGVSAFEDGVEDRNKDSQYGPKSAHAKRFRELAKDDASFAAYLENKGIQTDSLALGSGDNRAADIRKVISLVAVRHTYRTPDTAPQSRRLRSRKNPRLYTGADTIFRMVEGNPRWLIAVAKRLIVHTASDGTITPEIQSREINAAARRFLAMIETIPTDSPGNLNSVLSVGGLIHSIGNFMQHAVLFEPFNPDPPGSFTLDAACGPEIITAVGKALNVGALVCGTDANETNLQGPLTGMRFRLCHLLAPIFKLPIRSGRAVALSNIISHSAKRSSPQATMF